MMENDFIVKPLDYSGGIAKVPEGTGWGIELNENALQKYATGPPITIKM